MKKRIDIQSLLVFLLLFLFTLSVLLLKPLGDLDEIWTYNFYRNVANGLVPYRDFNMLQMPLLPLVYGLIIKIVTNQLIVIRIISVLVNALIFTKIFKIFKELGLNKILAFLFSVILCILFKSMYSSDYNFITILLLLTIILTELKWQKEYVKEYKTINSILLGFLGGLTFLLKQTTGFFICLVIIFNRLYSLPKKDKKKVFIKESLFKLLGMIIPISIMLIYLLINNAFGDFINYTLKGATEFNNVIPYYYLIWKSTPFFAALSVLYPVAIILLFLYIFIWKKTKELYLPFIYGLVMVVMLYPISDIVHFLFASLIIFVTFLALLLTKFRNTNTPKMFNQIGKCIVFILVVAFIGISVNNIQQYIDSAPDYSKLTHFEGIIHDRSNDIETKKVGDYIKEHDNVKIIDASAALYMIPIDRYNKNYDMLLKGNLGYNGIQNIIEEIKNNQDTEYLILNDNYYLNWQLPLEIIHYVKENKTKIGQISVYDIYK